MILEEETYKQFGYPPCDLKPQSHKKIIVKCDECEKIRECTKAQYSDLCFICSREGKNNPNWKGGKIKRTCEQCGKEFNVKLSEIKKGSGKYCSRKCQNLGYTKRYNGKDNPSWKGGVSFEPYCHKFNNEFKEYIRAKFGNVCFLCGKTEEENGEKLSVHHVNYDKDCGCAETEKERNADDNSCQFVPLCRSCNSRVNKNRDLWERRIKNEMKNKLNGWYI